MLVRLVQVELKLGYAWVYGYVPQVLLGSLGQVRFWWAGYVWLVRLGYVPLGM